MLWSKNAELSPGVGKAAQASCPLIATQPSRRHVKGQWLGVLGSPSHARRRDARLRRSVGRGAEAVSAHERAADGGTRGQAPHHALPSALPSGLRKHLRQGSLVIGRCDAYQWPGHTAFAVQSQTTAAQTEGPRLETSLSGGKEAASRETLVVLPEPCPTPG